MTPRERYCQTLLFGAPDKIPLQPGGPRESTLAAWRRQGLPEGANYYQALFEALGIQPEPARPGVDPGASFRMIPQFEEQVLEHRDGHYVVRDWMGAITEISDRYDYTYIRAARDFVTRKWHKFPVQDRRDWEENMRWRYDPASPERFPADFADRCARLRGRDWVAGLHFNGPFWQLREWLGFEQLCLLMAEDPDFIEELAAFWTDFVSRTLAVALVDFQPDYAMISEDMAYKMHSMISPAMVRRFLGPAYQRWVPQLKQGGCPLVSVDSDGHIGELIPLWIEYGMRCTVPVEVAAGNDIVDYRRCYGPQMAFIGGLDKRALAQGGKAMEVEVRRVVPPLLRQGGYIPGCDHGVPPDISWPNYVAYSRLLAQLTGWL